MSNRTPNEIIDDLARARAANNVHWMQLIRLAWEVAPDRAREISKRINAQDCVVVGLAEELAGGPPKITLSLPDAKKAVILPGGGVLHTYAVREALALGLTPIVTDRDPDCPCAKIPGVEFHQIDCYDDDWHANFAKDQPEIELTGAFCGGADTHVVVAAIHEAMDWTWRWVSRKTAETCKDKLKAKEALLAAGVPTANFAGRAALCSESVAVRAGIWKPRDKSGSRGVCRHVIGDVIPGDGVFEELLEGPEQSVEILLFSDRSWCGINVVDRYFSWVDDQPLEVGHTNPSRRSDSDIQALYSLCAMAAKAVGANVGFFKCDTIWTKDGPKVLECTPRLSGGYDSQLSTPLSSGRNLLRYGLQLACGLKTDDALLDGSRRESVTVIHRPHLATAEVMRLP